MSDTIHALPSTRWQCLRYNRKGATLALIFSLGVLLGGFLALIRPIPASPPGPDPFLVRLGLVDGAAVLSYVFLSVRCAHERLWFGIAATASVILAVRSFEPSLVASVASELAVLDLALWTAATMVSVYFVRSAFRGMPPRASSGEHGGQ